APGFAGPASPVGGAPPRNAHAALGLSGPGGEAGTAPQAGRRDLRAQPSVWRRRADPRRQPADAGPLAGAGASRDQAERSLHRRGNTNGVVRGERVAVKQRMMSRFFEALRAAFVTPTFKQLEAYGRFAHNLAAACVVAGMSILFTENEYGVRHIVALFLAG